MDSSTAIEIIEIDDLSDCEFNPDAPIKCVGELLKGCLDGAIQCAELQVGPYAKLNPLFNVEQIDSNTFSFLTFNSVEVGDTFTCANDPAVQKAIDTENNVKMHAKKNLARQIHVALSEPIEFESWVRLRTFESYKSQLTDSDGNQIQRYSLCTLSNGDDSSEVFCIEDVNIEEQTVDLSSLSRCPYALYSLTVKPTKEVRLCAITDDDQISFNILNKLRPVFKGLGDCHQIDLIHYIDSLVIDGEHSLLQVAEELIKRMMTLIGIEKQTVNVGIQYPPLLMLNSMPV